MNRNLKQYCSNIDYIWSQSIVVLLVLISSHLYGETNSSPRPKDTLTATTHHQLSINDKSIQYQAKAGYLTLKGNKAKAQAKVFYIAYFKKTKQNLSKRPITFAFNGGPGASSVWLHLGALGPKRILLTDKGESLAPPYQLIKNNYWPSRWVRSRA